MARSVTPARSQSAAWQVPAALLLLGACAVGVGLLLRGPLAAGAAEESDALQAAPVVDARSLNDVAIGTRVLAYGRIATTTEAPHGLVAFVHQQYEGTEQSAPNKKRPRWRELARHTPALQLDIDGRMVSIAAGEYELDSPPHERAPEGGPVASTLRLDLRLVDLSTQRVRGFAAYDAVTVDGTVAAGAVAASAGAGDGARTLQAQRLHGGDVAAYRAARSAGVDALPMIGAIFTALGLAVLALGGVLLRRAQRTPPAAQGTRMTIDERWHTPLMLGAFGLVFFTVGLYAAYDTWRKDGDLAGRLRAAPVVDAANIGAQPVGATVLVEGTVAARNPVIESGLVTLLRQEAEAVSIPGKSDLRLAWKTLRAEARPLWVDTPAGAVAIVNTDYAWRDPPRRVPDDPGTVTPGTLRAAGFGVGDAIVAHAVVVTHEGAAALRAVEIDSGTRAAYLVDKQASDWVGYILGGAFALVGLALLVSAGIGIRRASAAPVPGAAE